MESSGKRKALIGVAVVLVVAAGAIVLFRNNGKKTESIGMTCVANVSNKYEGMPEDKTERFNAIMTEYEKKETESNEQLSEKCYEAFSKFKDEVKEFKAEDVTELATRDIVKGSGGQVTATSEYASYYIGWLADGTIFDSSIGEGKLKAPLSSKMQLIEGWSQGVLGMNIGGVREITIPYAQAYGEAGNGPIPAKSPLKFIVMTIPKTGIAWPSDMVSLCVELFTESYGDETQGMCEYSFANN